MIQRPYPGEHVLLFRGDTIKFELSFDGAVGGRAFVRTNIGNAAVQREETVSSARTGRPRSGQDWHDIPLARSGDSSFSISLALLDEGHFEAKCFHVEDEEKDPRWVEGPNVHINVEPSSHCCANSIYCAFVRQFGLNKDYKVSRPIPKLEREEIAELDRDGYTVIPPSGTFRALMKCLDHIIDRLNCRIIHLLPINPTPTTYARMGRYGSPYASLDFTGVDPSLAEFDRKATPLDQFLELVDAVHRRNAKLFIDLAINHTGWAAKIHETHPEWLIREGDGNIHSPGAWGVVWGDLTELNHNRTELWDYLSEVFLVWCARGVDGFRCDAGYMIPERAWEFIISKVRQQYPGTIFLLEGLGGDPAVTRRLLDNANMNWAYSELFQNYSREQIEGYLPFAHKTSLAEGIMVHYAETHDNKRLAAVSETYARMRTALCALASNNGAFGFTNGVEWFAKERIDVHESNALSWGSEPNQVAHISRLNTILIAHPAFHNGARTRTLDTGSPDVVAIERKDSAGSRPLLVLVNLNCEKHSDASWPKGEFSSESDGFVDLISEKNFTPDAGKFTKSLKLAPGQALCLSPRTEDMKLILDAEEKELIKTDRIAEQDATAMALDLLCWRKKSCVIVEENPLEMAGRLLDDPFGFCQSLFADGPYCPVVEWKWPQDIRRTVLVPPGHVILIRAPHNFRARISENGRILVQRDSLKSRRGFNFALLPPLKDVDRTTRREMKITVYADDRSHRETSSLVFLPEPPAEVRLRSEFDYARIVPSDMVMLSVNGRGGMCRQPVKWGELGSRYDCLLAGNLSTRYPEDRHIMWTRCRICTDHHGRKEWFTLHKLDSFSIGCDGNSGIWRFSIPLGNGIFVRFEVGLRMVDARNQTVLSIRRLPANPSGKDSDRKMLDDKIPLKLVIRPDLEDRNFHQETKAYMGPESLWPNQISASAKSFVFEPSADRKICVSTNKGAFRKASEWSYAIYRVKEAERGLDPYGDLFSPGYFEVFLAGGEEEVVTGSILTGEEPDKEKLPPGFASIPRACGELALDHALEKAAEKFIVRREDWKTVIAGYPWFLDWGRDTLIAARGLITAGKLDEVRKILLLFAKFAENGTIPNMIHGGNASNRDTSDAPLWLFIATRDFCQASRSDDILSEKLDSRRNLLDALVGIAHSFVSGTPNGIKMDPGSGLVFSPSHFTWMDTNFPAATPRQGYPVEIQALWIAALSFIHQKTGSATWQEISARASDSLARLYRMVDPPTGEFEWLSDCLHCDGGVPAGKAVPDDHLRPNQLLAVTLGALADKELQKGILRACSELLIPGGIRSLADREVKYELPVRDPSGKALNNPRNPYFGAYAGAEDISRKPAYHNGTAWTWLFPSYAEALLKIHGETARGTAGSIILSSLSLLEDGCICNIPEILDGDSPHRQRGCDAQAWGVTELIRVWRMISEK